MLASTLERSAACSVGVASEGRAGPVSVRWVVFVFFCFLRREGEEVNGRWIERGSRGLV